jgi:hypothetical protein
MEPYDQYNAPTQDRIALALCLILEDDAPKGWERYRQVAESIVLNKELMTDLLAFEREKVIL